MSETYGSGTPKELLPEQKMPTLTEEGISVVLARVIELEAQAANIGDGKFSAHPENTASRLNAKRDARTAINTLKLLVPDETGSWERYIDAKHQAMKDEITQAADRASTEQWSKLGSAALQQDTDTPTEHNGFEPGVEQFGSH